MEISGEFMDLRVADGQSRRAPVMLRRTPAFHPAINRIPQSLPLHVFSRIRP
jgi:hypothetical protein